MKREFKLGQRVMCYAQNQNGTFDVINEDGDSGTIVGAIGPTGVEVKMDNDYMEGRVCTFHPRQLVRLVKKKRREWWITVPLDESLKVDIHFLKPVLNQGPNGQFVRDYSRLDTWIPIREIIHVREVKERK